MVPSLVMAEIRYRRAGLDDVETLADLRCRFIEEGTGKPVDQSLRSSIREAYRAMTRDGRAASWLALDGAEAAGTGTLIFWQRIPGPHSPTGKYAYIMNMYTRPESRRLGIASTIVSRLVETAKDAGLNRVALHTLPAALDVYLKAGFVLTDNEMALRW